MHKGRMREMTEIGIDVSKRKLDVCWLKDAKTLKRKTKVFPNSEAGYQQLLAWLEKQIQRPLSVMQVMMEATGVYHEGVAYALHEAGVEVFVTNPAHAREFAKSLGARSKTDKKDSVMLARFLASRSHQRWQPEPEEVRYLKALLARLAALNEDLQRERNRLEKNQIQGVAGRVTESIYRIINSLEVERRRLIQEIDDHIDGHPELRADRQRLHSIPGIGEVLSAELLAMLRSRDFKRASQSAAFVGLIPLAHQSGTSVDGRPHLSKTGGARLRAKLYMAAVVAKRCNPDVRALYDRLKARGKAEKSALGAAMRKLVQIAFGVLKNQSDYRPQGVT